MSGPVADEHVVQSSGADKVEIGAVRVEAENMEQELEQTKPLYSPGEEENILVLQKTLRHKIGASLQRSRGGRHFGDYCGKHFLKMVSESRCRIPR